MELSCEKNCPRLGEYRILSLGLLKWELLLNQQKKASKRRNSYLSQAIESRSGIPMVDKGDSGAVALNDEVPSLSE